MWDPDEDHNAAHYESWPAFHKAVLRGMRSGKGFRIAWSGEVSVEYFEKFCELCFVCLDGDRQLFILIEELADVSSAGKASHWFGQLCRKARKYNGVLHWTSQRSEEIPKTVFSQTPNYYIGYPNDTAPENKVRELARLARCPGGANDLRSLKPLEFFIKKGTESERKQLKYKNL